jgi:hypothetical protein
MNVNKTENLKKLLISPKNLENFLILKMCPKNWKMSPKILKNFNFETAKNWKM